MATAIDTSKETHADVAAAEVLRRFVGYYKPYKALFFKRSQVPPAFWLGLTWPFRSC